MSEWTMRDLEMWDDRIRKEVTKLGLDVYDQEFEVCDQEAMLGYMAYHGMPSHYPHWSYGKSFEQLKTMYSYGVQGLPYEMVINSDPCLAYLMRDNSLCLQVLTIAHVYGHNDFFKNNFTFTSATRAGETIAGFKTRADRVRRYLEDPSIGTDAVERVLDAAHALSMNRSRNQAIRRLKPDEQKRWVEEASEPQVDEFSHLQPRQEREEVDLSRVPLEPDENLLLFIRDHNPELTDHERDLLTIVDEEACYFIPQIETKIMNEGWASYWHHQIMTALDLPQAIHLEFMVRHNQVICPHPGSLNPYYLGFVIWHEIERGVDAAVAGFTGIYKYRKGADGRKVDWSEEEKKRYTKLARHYGSGRAAIFGIRESDRDIAFLRRFLTPEIMRKIDLFSYKPRGQHLVVDRVADEEHYAEVKAKLLAQTGTASLPVIKVIDADYGGRRTLMLRHEHDGRDLDLNAAEKTLEHLHTLWRHDVYLQTKLRNKKALMSMTEEGFDSRLVA